MKENSYRISNTKMVAVYVTTEGKRRYVRTYNENPHRYACKLAMRDNVASIKVYRGTEMKGTPAYVIADAKAYRDYMASED